MKDVNDLMQAILEMDAAQRRESEKARLERSARLAALDEQKQKIIAECDAREKSESDAAARAAEEGNAAALAALLNRNLTFVAPVDLSSRLLSELCSQISPELVPVISAAAAILQDSAADSPERRIYEWLSTDAGRSCIEHSGYVAVQ